MFKKIIALSLAVLVMASHMVSVYATDHLTDNWTENGVTGKIYYTLGDPNYRTFWASTSANGRRGYISASVLLESAETNAYISSNYADGHNLNYVDTFAYVDYGRTVSVRVRSTHQVGSSDNDITTSFGLIKVYIL